MKNISTTTNSNESFAIKIKGFCNFYNDAFLLSGIPSVQYGRAIDNEAILELIPDELTRVYHFILETYDRTESKSERI